MPYLSLSIACKHSNCVIRIRSTSSSKTVLWSHEHLGHHMNASTTAIAAENRMNSLMRVLQFTVPCSEVLRVRQLHVQPVVPVVPYP